MTLITLVSDDTNEDDNDARVMTARENTDEIRHGDEGVERSLDEERCGEDHSAEGPAILITL